MKASRGFSEILTIVTYLHMGMDHRQHLCCLCTIRCNLPRFEMAQLRQRCLAMTLHRVATLQMSFLYCLSMLLKNRSSFWVSKIKYPFLKPQQKHSLIGRFRRPLYCYTYVQYKFNGKSEFMKMIVKNSTCEFLL